MLSTTRKRSESTSQPRKLYPISRTTKQSRQHYSNRGILISIRNWFGAAMMRRLSPSMLPIYIIAKVRECESGPHA
jgi:hypothetical protein